MYVSRDICGGEGEDARIYVHTYSTLFHACAVVTS